MNKLNQRIAVVVQAALLTPNHKTLWVSASHARSQLVKRAAVDYLQSLDPAPYFGVRPNQELIFFLNGSTIAFTDIDRQDRYKQSEFSIEMDGERVDGEQRDA